MSNAMIVCWNKKTKIDQNCSRASAERRQLLSRDAAGINDTGSAQTHARTYETFGAVAGGAGYGISHQLHTNRPEFRQTFRAKAHFSRRWRRKQNEEVRVGEFKWCPEFSHQVCKHRQKLRPRKTQGFA